MTEHEHNDKACDTGCPLPVGPSGIWCPPCERGIMAEYEGQS